MSAPDRLADPDVAAQIERIRALARATPPPSHERQRAADALRALGAWLVAGDAAEAQLERVAAGLEAIAEEFGGARGGEPFATRFAGSPHPGPEGVRANAHGAHPLLGSANPVAPPLALRVEGDRVVADVCFDVRYEGHPGWVHGGFVAAGFDIVLVQAARLSGRGGPTGSLHVRFRSPTPIAEPLRYVGWFEGASGRKLTARGRLERLRDGATTAEAEAIAIAPDPAGPRAR